MWPADICTQPRSPCCIFCDIAAGSSQPRALIHRDELVVAFDDIDPASRVHVLVRMSPYGSNEFFRASHLPVFLSQPLMIFKVIPREHIRDVSALADSALRELRQRSQRLLRAADTSPVARMVAVGAQILKERGFHGNSAKMGFHVPPFISVQHLHLHCLALPLNNLWRDIK